MPQSLLLLPLCLFLAGCTSNVAIKTPVNLDLDAIETACDHLALLGCKEGRSSYDSDTPGVQGVPNTTCAEAYAKRMLSGTCINVLALSKVSACNSVRATEQQGCD